jgi:Tol biopolymer transport system component
MGIYQRNLTNYTQTAVIENRMSGKNCMNCHSFCMQDPSKMLFHMRETYPGTILVDGSRVEKLNTGTGETISPLVYPSWYPSGRYVAFSVNKTLQSFHHNDRNRIEVFDEASDVVVYDVEKHQIITTSKLFSPGAFETFPTFSPDGQTLYFCSAQARDMPHSFKDVKYSLCSISFDAAERAFDDAVDTLYNAVAGGLSASFPRVSPDGRFLLYTLSGYGNFSIWHTDADLHMINLPDGVSRPLRAANSPEVESYHSWSSNSRWIVFSSRRGDGLYTRPY